MDSQRSVLVEDTDELTESDYISSDSKCMSKSYGLIKRILDIICSTIGLLALFPLLSVISILIVTTSNGSAIFRQRRIGKSGKPFTIYKFRTMINGAENLQQYLTEEQYRFYLKNRKLKDDPRITKFGNFLRASSLDELPQLLNVFIGNMSIVGPRPMLPEEILQYGSAIQFYNTVRPGITGLWQVSARRDTRMCARAVLDKQYVSNFSLKWDIKIMIATFRVVITKKGAI